MAEQLTNFKFNRPDKTKYPWDQWLDGSVWRLVHGEDFLIEQSSMRHLISYHANTRSGTARVQKDGDDLIIQFSKPSTNGKRATQ